VLARGFYAPYKLKHDFLEETEAPSGSFLNFLVLHEGTEAPSSSFLNFLVLHEETDAQGQPGEIWPTRA